MVKDNLLPLRAECTMLFQSNPYMVESIDGLELRLGREKENLVPVLELLVKQGILQLLGDESIPLYRYKEPFIITELESKSTPEGT
ncbi:hypothetical protein SAMN05216232_1172 [Virgibacillus subterraneus]|uniref:Uncharacterized protein n=2 Tax=Virgibacillus TaxID=84406 RepID=A0A1H0Z634_9BACI|nr:MULTISPECIES: hypothetical protein [Virgibacillus]SDQ22922.1 hypothetical protein SAMN05216231_1049 [Virgibacillus salinus]SEP87716.1 hypothetical protein SAMN05216232_1172 [Virgibacillus subterraneus]